MLTTKRKPASVAEILIEEFMEPMGLTQGALAAAMGVQRKHVNELCNGRRSVTAATALILARVFGNSPDFCNGRRSVTAATALILARVFGNSPDFWLNAQRRSDLWEVMNSPTERARVKRARPLKAAT